MKWPVSGCTQRQNNRIRYFNHGLQSWSHHDEEDDTEEKGALQCLHVQKARLEGEQQQGDPFSHTSEDKGQWWWCQHREKPTSLC